jgi:putative tricarboxylic transport membrane protein
MKNLDQKSPFFWIIISTLVVILSSKLPFGSFANPGAGFLPLLVGVLMFLLSFILFIQSFSKKEEGVKTLWTKGGTGRVLLILSSLVFYGLFLEKFGFILMTFLLMGFLLLAIGKVRKSVVILLSLLSSLGCYGVFQLWLNVQLPKGIFGF